ncbi:conserved Plasmodium protein, unknown function [Plasmodium knowlesi strain H]|uniref:Uncharacterized protein n=1 Tax=Plasmodium knowlesi (strain H) TaxID=5851 RepID=B3L1K4_PLAKH|nr:conserved Plasmodium protein, unknown function [Plasmodium knowlesi strain H]CAA9986991.1 conserved Plasmodium protein, unknown function [Plasmodium knowlesi strain H]VVS76465.1 conserved Plasmodium protein, unknown function [Plasmodium knowlesi strain H]|eukprot:XP_002258236.1 hypothetical protein, conserved in Plasmodium species [Plasmodium knowlesi strain H]
MSREVQNKFDLVDVEPKFLEFLYECTDNVETFLENKKNVIKRKRLKIKNICTKTQNIKICEPDSKYLKIKGIKNKKLAPGTSEQIFIEFSFADVNFKTSKFVQTDNILDVVNNVESTSYVTIRSEYTTLNIPIYIKKSIPVFAYDDVINFGVCNANRAYQFALRVKNVGTRRGTFTLSLDDSPRECSDECADDQQAECAQSRKNSGKFHLRKYRSEDMMIQLDQSSLDLDVGETKIINISISSMAEGKMHKEYRVISNQHSYFVEKQRKITIFAIFTSSHTSFLFNNEKTNLVNLHCLYYGSRKKYQGKIKNENNYAIFCIPQVDAVNVFYSKEDLEAYAVAKGLDLSRICPDVYLQEEEHLSEGEKKEKEKLFSITKKRLKGEEHIGITFSRVQGYPIEKLSYQEISFEVYSKCDTDLLHRLSRDTSYLLNFPVVVELSLRVGRSHRETGQGDSATKQVHSTTKQVHSGTKHIHSATKQNHSATEQVHSATLEGAHTLDEEVKICLAFCLTFPCILPSTYLLNYDTITPNEGKTLIIELKNRNKFMKLNYTLSKIPYLTLSKSEGVISPQGKVVLSLKLQCDSVKMMDDYMYLYFCNNLYFIVLLVRGNIISSNALRKGSSSILLNLKAEPFRRNETHGKIKQNHDEVYEQILKNLELERVDRNFYQLDGKLDKYKYNERFINFLKKNKKKYNDVLKLMYEKRKKGEESIQNASPSAASPDTSEQMVKGKDRLSKILKDKFIYVNDPPVERISNTYINKGVYEQERKKYIQMKTKNLKIKNEERAQGGEEEEPYLMQFDMLDEEELNKVEFVRMIQYGYIFLGADYTRKFVVFNRNKHCNVKVALTHGDNITTDGEKILLVGRDSHKMRNVKLNIKCVSREEEVHQDDKNCNDICLNSGKIGSQTGVSTSFFGEDIITGSCADLHNDFFLLKMFEEKISLMINDSHKREVTLGATLVFLNVLVNPTTVYFRFHDEDVEMVCERHLVLYNPFNVPLNVGMVCNQAHIALDSEILVPPNSHKIVPLNFVATESATSVSETIRLYLDGSRLYKSLKCKFIANKCSYRVTPTELNFENILLNRNYVKEFFLINTGDSPVVFRCNYKPDCVSLLSKYNYVKKNEKVKISVLLNLKEGKKIKDKIVLTVRGAPQLILPLNVKGTPSNVLICEGIHIQQRRGELKCYEVKILNRGSCDETILVDTSSVDFLNVQMGNKKETTFSKCISKEYKDANKMEDVVTVQRIYSEEYDDLLTDECAKYHYNNFLKLHNSISVLYQNKGQILLKDRGEVKSMYRVVVPSKCFLPLCIQCYSSKAIRKEIAFQDLLHHNRVTYDITEELIKIDIEEGHLDVAPSFLHFTDLIPHQADEAYISYFSKEKTKRITIRNVFSQPVQWAIRLDEEKRREIHVVTNVHRGVPEFTERKGGMGKSKRMDSVKSRGSSKSHQTDEPIWERQYQVYPSRHRGILQPNEETTVDITLSGFKLCGRYVDVLDISSSIFSDQNAGCIDGGNDASNDASNDARNDARNDVSNHASDDARNDASDMLSNLVGEAEPAQKEEAEREVRFSLYMLICCDIPKLQFDVTYINIIHNKLNDYCSFPFDIYNHGYNYVRVDYHFKNLHAECFSISLDFINGNEINEQVKKLRMSLKCKATKSLKFKSHIVFTVMDYHQYTIPLFVNIDEGIDFLLEKAATSSSVMSSIEETGEVIDEVVGEVIGEVVGEVIGEVVGEVIGEVVGEVIGEVVGEVVGEGIPKQMHHMDDYLPPENSPKGASKGTYPAGKPTEGIIMDSSLQQHMNTTDIQFDKQNELFSFFCKNMEEVKKGSTNGNNIYKGLKINNIRNVYYNEEEEGVYPLREIIGDYLFVFIQRIMLRKSYFPQVIESTNDLFLFFLDLLLDLFSSIYPNRNLQNIIVELKKRPTVVVKDMKREDLLDEMFTKNVQTLWKSLKEEEYIPLDHIIYENLLPADLYLFHVLDKVPDYFHVEEKHYEDNTENLSIKNFESFLLNGNKKVFYFEKIFKTHVRLFSYSWVTIFLEVLNRKMFGAINMSSLTNLRGIKLYSIENKLNENIKMYKISYLVILDTEDMEVNKHGSFLNGKKGRSRRKEASTLTKLHVNRGGTGTRNVAKSSLNTRNGNLIYRDKSTSRGQDKYAYNYVKKKTTKDKPSCTINYFNFYENNFIDLKKIVNKISRFCYSGGVEELPNGKQETVQGKNELESSKGNTNIEGDDIPTGGETNTPFKKKSTKEDVKESTIKYSKDTTKDAPNGIVHFKSAECILFEWLYFHYNNVYHAKVEDKRYIFKEARRKSDDELSYTKGNSNETQERGKPEGSRRKGNPSGSPSFVPSDSHHVSASGELVPSQVHENTKMSTSNFQVEIKRKKKEVQKKKKAKSIHELKDLVMILYTIISHIPYYLFFKKKIKLNCKSKRDYSQNIDVLLIMLSEMNLSNLISRQVIVQFNYMHIYLFLASLYFILPKYLPCYYLVLDDLPAYKVDLSWINDEVVNSKKGGKSKPMGKAQQSSRGKQAPQKKTNAPIDGENEKTSCGDDQTMADERIITVYNLNSHICKYEVFLIGCNKYQIDRNYVSIDPLKSEQIKLKIDKGYDEKVLKYSNHTSIKLPYFKKKRHKGDMCDGEEPHFEDNYSVSSCSSEDCQCPSDGADKVDAGIDEDSRVSQGENYTILVLRSESNRLQDEKDSEKYICIKLVELGEKGKIELAPPGTNIRGEKNEGNNVNANVNNGGTRSEVNKVRTTNSSHLNIMLNDSETKCFNLRGKVYENKCIELNLFNNTGKEVEVNSNLYHLYVKNLKKEEKGKENFETDVVNKWGDDHLGGHNQCVVCSIVNANLRNHLSDTSTHFSCVHLVDKNRFTCLQNERKKIQVQFCPFAEGSYFCFLLFNVNDKKTNYIVSACKVNCSFNINNVKEEEIIKMNSKIFNFSYHLKVCPVNREFLKCVKFILCNLNHLDERHFLSYLRGYLEDIHKGRKFFSVLCDNEDKISIEKGFATFGPLDCNKYMEKILYSEGVDIDQLYELVKKETNYTCTLEIAEKTNGVFEYNCALVSHRNVLQGKSKLSYEQMRKLHIKEQKEICDPFYKVYKIIASVNDGNSSQSLSITFKTSAFQMVKKSIPVYNYTNGVVTYRRVYSDVIDENNKIVGYNIFSCPEYIEIGKEVESVNFEVSCYSIIGLTCSCCITLYNVNNEEEQIKINVQANVMKPYPKDTIHLKLLNRTRKTAQIEIYNDLNFHCEFKVYSDLPILFGVKKIEMMPKQKKTYTFFVTSAHIGEYMGCIIFKHYKLLRSGHGEEKKGDSFFPFANYFFWYKLNITVELNKPLKILFLETNVGEEVKKDIVLKNNGNENENYFLLAYMNEYIERRQVQIPKNDIYVYSIKYAPKIPNYFNEDGNGESASGENNDPTLQRDIQNFYYPHNGDSDWCGPPGGDEPAHGGKEPWELSPNQGATLKHKHKPFPPTEKKIFEDLISYCNKYIQVDIAYRPHNIGFFFIYNKNEGINYYILMLLSRMKSHLDVRNFSTCLSKSCFLHLHFQFNEEDERYVHLLEGMETPPSSNYHYQIVEGVKCPPGEKHILIEENFRGAVDMCRAYEEYDDKWGEEMQKGNANNYMDAPIYKDNPYNGGARDQVKHELKCIYLSNRNNFHIVKHKDVNRVVLKYRPTVNTSQECYAIIRSNLHGDFLYRIHGKYTVKRKIKEKLVLYNSCCLYNFNVNLFNPFNCKVRVKCRFKGGNATQLCNHMCGAQGMKEKDIDEKYMKSFQKERVVLNKERYYLKILNKENFKIKMRKHFTIMMTYFCKAVYSRRTVLIMMKPFRRDRTHVDGPPMIIYEYDFVFNNFLRSRRIQNVLQCIPAVGEIKDEQGRGNCDQKQPSTECEDLGVNTSCYFHSSVDEPESGNQASGNFTMRHSERGDVEANLSEVSDVEAHQSEQSESIHTSRSSSVASERSHFTLNASELGVMDVAEGDFKLEDADTIEIGKNHTCFTHPDDKALLSPNDYDVEHEIKHERVLPCASDNKEVVHYDGKIFIESMCKTKTYVEVHIDKTKMGTWASCPQGMPQGMDQLEMQNNSLHRNVEMGNYNYKIFLLNLKNVRKNMDTVDETVVGGTGGAIGMDVKMNTLLFDVNEGLLNDYLYVHIVEDTEARLVLTLELLAFLPFHCSFDVFVSRRGGEGATHHGESGKADQAAATNKAEATNQAAATGQSVEEAYNVVEEFCGGKPRHRCTTFEQNHISVEILNCMNVSRQYLNITVGDNLCGETRLNIFYNHTRDSYFDAYMVKHNQLNNSSHWKDEILNFEVKPKCGILKHGSYNKFFITRTNKNGLLTFNNSFLLLIKTERNVFSYMVFSHYRAAPSDALATEEHNKIKEILNENKKKFSVLFSSFRKEKKESSIFNQKNQIIIEDISKSTNEIRNA